MADTAHFLQEEPDVQELLNHLKQSNFYTEHEEYRSLIHSVDVIVKQYDTMCVEHHTLLEKLTKIDDTLAPILKVIEQLEKIMSGIREKLNQLKDNIHSFTAHALLTLKENALSITGQLFREIHLQEGLQAVSNELSKCVESVNHVIGRVDHLVQYENNKTKNPEEMINHEEIEHQEMLCKEEVKEICLIGLRTDTLNIEDIPNEELSAIYEELIIIGMENEGSIRENQNIVYCVNNIYGLLPDNSRYYDSEQTQIIDVVDIQDTER